MMKIWNKFKSIWRKPKDLNRVTILPLTPRDDAEGIAAYISRLDAAFADKSIKNIAVTGKFGAGKSSVLKTYFKNKEVLWISLAPFIEYAHSLTKDNNKKNTHKIGRLLEISILKQMFYTTKQEDLPFSRFSRIIHNDWRHYTVATFVVVTLLTTILFVWQPGCIWGHFGDSEIGRRTTLAHVAYIVAMVPITIAVMALYDVIRRHKLHGRFSAAGAELELGSKYYEMSFSRTIDEIIYHFQRLKYDAVVFEDVDRYPGTVIFSKLKEMNHIINESKDIRDKAKPIRFVYALRDMVLKDEERVKFFDYILPIVPITSIANSRAYFTDSLKRSIKIDKLEPRYTELINSVSQYIVDLRLINNICNEFSVYNEMLGADVPGPNLLGITIFKNILPSEYENLLRGQGVVVKCLEMAEEKISATINELREELVKLESQIVNCADSDDVSQLKKKVEEIKQTKIKWGKLNFRKLLRLKEISANEVLRMIEDAYDKENDIHRSGEVTRIPLEQRQKDVLLALLSGGYIDENYRHYLSMFKAELISEKDHKFVLSVVRNNRLPEDYDIDSIAAVLLELNTWLLEREAALNYSLASSALMETAWPPDKRDVFLSYIFENSSTQVCFIDTMMQHSGDSKELYKALVEWLSKFHIPYLVNLVDEASISTERKLCQIGMFFKTQPDLTKIPISVKVLDFLKSIPDLGFLFRSMRFSVDDVAKLLEGGRLVFDTIDFSQSDDFTLQVIAKVIETNSYTISRDNLRGFVNTLGCDTSRWEESAGTVLYGCGNRSILQRLDFDLLVFLEGCCFEANEQQKDDARFVEYVLNHPLMSSDVVRRFLTKQVVGISDARSIKKSEYIDCALVMNKLKPAWENVTEYYRRFIEESDINPIGDAEEESRPYREKLLRYLEANRNYFENHRYDVGYDYDYLVIAIIVGAKSLHDAFVKKIVEGCGTLSSNIWIEDTMPANRLLWLKNKSLIKFDYRTAKRLKGVNKVLFANYVALFVEGALGRWQDLNVSDEELLLVLKSEYIDAVHAAAIAKTVKDRNNISDELKCVIASYISLRTIDEFDGANVCDCFGFLCPVALQCHIVNDYEFDKKNSLIALKLMPEPYSNLRNQGITAELPRSEIILRFLLHLRKVGIVKSFRKHDKSYRVYTADSDEMPS